ncbi:MAG: sugar ABC transporter permease [Lachnospiraceae bacterium]|nr:sugar ABC transporter permease [Lachnospiraceae bacterium]
MSNKNTEQEVNALNEAVLEENTSEETAGAVTESSETPEKEEKKKKKRKKTYSVDELIQHSDEIVYEDEFHRKVKIKVKVKQGKLLKREARMGYVFVAPWIIGALVFLLVPVGISIAMAFSRVIIKGLELRFNGIENFQYIFEKEKYLLTELLSYLVDTGISVPLIVVFALIMAMLLNMKIRFRGLFRAIFFLPVIVVSGPVMTNITSDTSRVSTVDLEFVQLWLENLLPVWAANPIFDAFSNIIMILWYSGVQILIFLAAIQKIDTSLYEAAKIDGGSGWECFWKITLPTIKPMILLNAIYTLVFISQSNNWFIDRITVKYIEDNSNYGRASALAWLYTLIVLALVGVIVLLFMPKQDPYVRQVKRTKRLEKKTRKQIAKSHKRSIRNEKKFQKHVEKQAMLRAKGKLVEGGRGDE